ncbi:MAG: STAS-like domain-containing protein [Pseudomonadota bacterium]|jgi:hypothetical protein|nr:STAS-like domain-containing protein [Pseudomonadota bacterium]|tara:strand:- start:1386 stop:1730 length:345 start_codon:yes stop_codon:yes gene_type:complete
MSKCTLNVSEFTKDAFNRFIEDGDGSGEEFRIKVLSPALKQNDKVTVNLDGIHDEYGSSFLVEAFANLIRKSGFSYEELKQKLELRSENLRWPKEIWRYIDEAKKDSEGSILRR